MNKKDLEIFRVIGKIHSCILESKTFEEAITNSLKTLNDSSIMDYGIIWLKNNEDLFIPVYWLCPYDLAGEARDNSSLIAKCVSDNSSEFYDSKDSKNAIKNITEHYESVISPINLKGQSVGAIEFVKVKKFTSEEKDTCDALSMLLEIEINDNAPLANLPTNNEVLLSIKDIKKSFKNGDSILQVLKGINFNVFKGEFLCLLGESGCGKSTIMNIIGGLIGADSGSIIFDGNELIGSNSKKLTAYRRDNIGFVFQQYNLMPNLTAIENVKLIAELAKDPMDPKEALEMVNLLDKANNYPSTLSGGQQQRISIARAIVKNPKLLLADEPTAALDYETSIEVLSVFEKIMEKGSTLVMITHNEEIAKMANRVIRFRQGRVYETIVNLHPAKAIELKW